jgi:hypothetical protein
VRTRRCMYIPFSLAALALGQDLNARQAFEVLYPAIVDANLEDACMPLLHFLMVASTTPSATVDDPPTIRTYPGVPGHTITPEVTQHRRDTVLYRHLPALVPKGPGTAGDPAVLQVAHSLEHLVDGIRAERADRAARREENDATKTPRLRWGDRVTDRLLRLTRSPKDEDLPEYYHTRAAKPTKDNSDRAVLQEQVDSAAATLGTPAPQVTPTHAMQLRVWNFAGDSDHDIGLSILPLSLTPPKSMSKDALHQQAKNQERAEIFDLSGNEGSGASSAGDVLRMRNTKGFLPTGWMEARSQLRCEASVLGALLGTEHEVTEAYMDFLADYDELEGQLSRVLDDKLGPAAAPAVFVYSVQLQLYHWFKKQMAYNNRRPVRTPDFCAGLKTYETTKTTAWLPDVTYVPLLAPLLRAPNPSRPRNPAAQPLGAATIGITPGAAPAGAGGARDIPRRVQNSGRDPRLTGTNPLGNNVRTRTMREAIALGGDPPRVTRSGREMPTCLSWHCKGTCFANCDRAEDHVANSTIEANNLYGWSQRAFA